MVGNKCCWYDEVKNKVGVLHHNLHQNKFHMNQNFNIETTREKIECHFYNNGDGKSFQDMT